MSKSLWSLEKRFLDKVKSEREPNGCLLWKGRKSSKGYGLIETGGEGSKKIRATHAALLLIDVDVSKAPGLRVFHACDTPICVFVGEVEDEGVYVVNGKEWPRWGHLWLGTNLANTQDMWNKQRSAWQNDKIMLLKGNEHPNSKLNEVLVRRIRLEHKYGGGSFRYLSRLHKVSVPTIIRVIRRETWAHVA